MKKQKTYLVCPLNWGLGHASRMIPIINTLLNNKHKVIIGGDGGAIKLLQETFPNLKTIYIKDIKIHFSSKKSSFKLIKLLPKIIANTITEHNEIKRIIQKNKIDVLISDNRYGLWNKHVKTIFVTHQLMIKLPYNYRVFEFAVHQIIKQIINKYDECWIPDYSEINKSLSGDLAHKYPLPKNAKFIGILSRFKNTTAKPTQRTYNIVALLSGPEPSRTDLEDKIINKFKYSAKTVLIIQGNPYAQSKITTNNITLTSTLPAPEMKYQLKNAQLVISRPGYSTLMDFEYIKPNALLIATPGQTEQEYLMEHAQKHYQSNNQSNFNSLLIP